MALTPVVLLSLICLLILPTIIHCQAPAPGPSGPINVTDIFVKGGQYITFLRFLNQSQALTQIENQINSSSQGLTILAPTDNAFNNLPSGTLNKLSPDQQRQLIQYHILPQYYSLADLATAPNPIRTQATGQDGLPFGINVTGQANQNQVNVSSGVVTTQVNNALRQQPPLAVYQLDKVLLPIEFSEAKPPASSPPSEVTGKSPGSGSSSNSTKPAADGPTPAGSGSGRMSVGLSMVVGVWLFCMALF